MHQTTASPISPDVVVDQVRSHYADAARAVLDRTADAADATACCGPSGDAVFGEALYTRARSRGAARRGGAGQPRLRQPHRGRRAARGRGRPRPRLRRRDRRPAVRAAGRPDRVRLRPGHDRRDARARPAQRRRGGRLQRRVPQGPHRGHPAARRLASTSSSATASSTCSTDKAGGPRRDRPRPPPRRPDGRQRRRRRRHAQSRPNVPSAAASPAASPAPCRSASTARASTAAGLVDIEVTATHAVGDGLHGAIIRATKPAGWSADAVRPVDLPTPQLGLPVVAEASCCGGGCC